MKKTSTVKKVKVIREMRIEVYPDKTKPKKDGWNWRVVKGANKTENVHYAGHDLNTKGIAKRIATNHNLSLMPYKRLPLYVYNEKTKAFDLMGGVSIK